MRNILVTGGLGYIGSHTVVELLNKNYEVVVIDNLSNSKISVLDKIETITKKRPKFYRGDILDLDFLSSVFSENEIDGVIHFAALKAVGESVKKPLLYYETNVTGTVNVLKTMLNAGCKKIVFSSSATVYGMNNPAPFTEDMETSAINPYGYTKVCNERILIDIAKANEDFKVAILRYFNPIGAHESGLIGEDPNDIPNNLMPYIMQVANGKLEKLNIFGDDYDTVDGTGVRDYIHVVDLALGHIAAIEKIFLDGKNQPKDFNELNNFEKSLGENTIVVNLGTGRGYSVLEVLKAFEKASGTKIPYIIAPRREGDIATCYAKTDHAKKLLNWEAKKGLSEMCQDSFKFAVTINSQIQ